MKTDNKSYLGVSESFVFHSEQETAIKVIEITKVQSSGSMFVQVKPSGKKCRVKKIKDSMNVTLLAYIVFQSILSSG